MEKQKRKRKDRRDGRYLEEMDPLHIIMAHLLPHRTACEAFISEKIDLTNILTYLEQKNNPSADYKYTIFHIIAAAIAKTVYLRPFLNRFIAGRRYYQRDEVSLAFIVKRDFRDQGDEGLLFLNVDKDDTIDTLSANIVAGARQNRAGDTGSSMNAVNILARLPRCVLAMAIRILRILDFYGRVPYDIIREDPNHASVFITNLGSIQLNAGYHHLNDWGTNSIFLVIGEKHEAIFYNNAGQPEIRPALNLGITLDERIADGYYYSRSVKLFKYLLQHPQLLELPAGEEVSYDT